MPTPATVTGNKIARRWSRLWLWLAVLIMGAAGTMLLLRDDSIDARAVRVASARRWRTYLTFGNREYYWLNDTDILFFRQTDAQHVTAYRQRVLPPGPDYAPNHAPVIMSVFKATSAWAPGAISPDRRWLTCIEQTLSPYRFRSYILPLSGQGKAKAITTSQFFECWLPDSSGTISLTFVTQGKDQRHFKLLTKYLDDRKPIAADMPREMDTISWVEGLTLVLPSGHLLLQQDRDFNYGSMRLPSSHILTLGEVDPLRLATTPSIWKIAIPAGASHGMIRLSPRGDKILWMLHISRVTPLERWVRKLMPKTQWGTDAQVVWLISRLDGSGMRPIGWYDLFDPKHYSDTWIVPQWTPDGKHLSYVRDGSLFVLPVD
jgi:hypothetical protein